MHFYSSALSWMSKIVLERSPKGTMRGCASDKVQRLFLYILWRPYSAGCLLALTPWCIFHVCWKDKHSCTLMTLKCFWDSECMCVCVVVCSFGPLQWKACCCYSYAVCLPFTLAPKTPHCNSLSHLICVFVYAGVCVCGCERACMGAFLRVMKA